MEIDAGQLRWQIPSWDFGSSQIMLEDQEARRLSDLLENWPQVTIRGAARAGRKSAQECPTKRVVCRTRFQFP